LSFSTLASLRPLILRSVRRGVILQHEIEGTSYQLAYFDKQRRRKREETKLDVLHALDCRAACGFKLGDVLSVDTLHTSTRESRKSADGPHILEPHTAEMKTYVRSE
jgi:hypothetical protein